MQGYIFPIVLAGLLTVPVMWRISGDVEDVNATLAGDSEKAAGETAIEGDSGSLAVQSFSLEGSDLRIEFSAGTDILAPPDDGKATLEQAGFKASGAE